MTKKNVSTSRFPVLRTVIGVVAAAALAWVIVDRFETPSILPAATETIASVRPLRKAPDKPLWRDLSSAQQVALAPLAPEWDRMEGARKRRWIEVSARFASLDAAEQGRVQERMRQWMKLTPQQRELARENFSKTNKLAQGDKAANWENYKQLSADQKRKLASKPSTMQKSVPIALPDAPQLVVPMPCAANTARRGAECVLIGTPDAAAPSALAVTPAPVAPAAAPPPAPAPAASVNGGAVATSGAQPGAVQAANAGN
ncbi:hypothetical protein RCH14_001289 [Massilia sp. MP_M2]|uniref:DUF3106 domain-containing protein n=1 Tax=Massilia sp. MP_M2 TaxID=3071713 RepID=UPI00319E0E7B